MQCNKQAAAAQTSNQAVLQKYMALDQKGSIMAEYIWIDAEGNTRSKSRVGRKKLDLQRFVRADILRVDIARQV